MHARVSLPRLGILCDNFTSRTLQWHVQVVILHLVFTDIFIPLPLPSALVATGLHEGRRPGDASFRRTDCCSDIQMEERSLRQHHREPGAVANLLDSSVGRGPCTVMCDTVECLRIIRRTVCVLDWVSMLGVGNVLIVVASDWCDLLVCVCRQSSNAKATGDERTANPRGEDRGKVELRIEVSQYGA